MLRPSHLLSLVPNRARVAMRRVEQAIWRAGPRLTCTATAAGPEPRTFSEVRDLPREAVEPGTYWGKLFDQRWYHLALSEPTDTNSWLHFEEQGESTLHLDGVPWFGFDVAHKRCRLPAGVTELWVEANCVQSAIWHPNQKPFHRCGSHFDHARVCHRNDDAWHAYFDLQCLVDLLLEMRKRDNPTLPPEPPMLGQQDRMEAVAPEFRQLLRLLDRAIDALDREGIPALRRGLVAALGHLRVDKTFCRLVATGHGHLDLVWLWPERIGELKATHTFATVNRLMAEYPDFKFAYSQPASYEAVRRRSPELYEQVRQRIESGQWQPTGAMYVESDTMLPCGEALARSLELGQEGFRELRGSPSPLVWLPDVFGYSACLPQLMRLNGVEFFFTTKMTWNALNPFAHSSFVWRGNDGSEVVAHVVHHISGYNGRLRPAEIRGGMNAHRQVDVHPEFLAPIGYGDGGGGPTDAMCERARRLNKLASMPEIGWDHPEAFFERLAPHKDELPVHQGECYLEFHRGVFTTHRCVKDSFRAMERALQVAEAAAARTGCGIDLTHAWKRAIFSQFHDYVPGSSVWDVYAEGVPEFTRLAKDVLSAAKASMESEAGKTDCLFNPHARTVRLALDGNTCIDLPPLTGIDPSAAPRTEVASVEVKQHTVSNGLVSFSLDDDGFVSALTWPEGQAPIGPCFGALMIYPDHPAAFNAWDIDRQTLSLHRLCDSPATIEPCASGNARHGLAVTRSIGKSSYATVRFLLEPGSAELHLELDLDLRDTEVLVKLYLPTGYRGHHARFGAPFGSVLRSQTADGATTEAMWEVPFSRHLEVFEEGEGRGLAVLSESCYGATVRDGAIGVSLVRSALITGRERHAGAWPAHLSRLENPPTYSDLGTHRVRLALGNYGHQLPAGRQPAALADTLFTPPLAYRGVPMPAPFAITHLDPTVVPAWVKPTANGAWLVRLHEVGGRTGTLSLACADGWLAAPAAFDGTATTDLTSELSLQIGPYKIETLTVRQATSG